MQVGGQSVPAGCSVNVAFNLTGRLYKYNVYVLLNLTEWRHKLSSPTERFYRYSVSVLANLTDHLHRYIVHVPLSFQRS